jgi:hypothetical protein
VTQVTGGWGKTSLIPHLKAEEAENNRRRNRLEQLRDFVTLNSGRNALAVTYQDAEEWFTNLDGVATGHFNAIAGLDQYRNVRSLFVIGRPLPRPTEVARIARALTGLAFRAEEIETTVETRGALMRDGTGRAVETRVYADASLEMIRTAITDAEVMQAIGRARGINRMEDNPVDIFVLADVALPLEVKRIVPWRDARPDVVARMFARGAALFSPTDAFRAYPSLFPSPDAARMALTRRGVEQPNKPLRSIFIGECSVAQAISVAYRPEGKGLQTRHALVPEWRLPMLREWLEKVVGPLALFTVADTAVREAPVANGPEASDTKIPPDFSNPSAPLDAEPLPGHVTSEPVMPVPEPPSPSLHARAMAGEPLSPAEWATLIPVIAGGYGDAPATLPGMAVVPFSMVAEAVVTNRATGATGTVYCGGVTIRTPPHPRRFIPVACPDDPVSPANADRPPAWIPPWERGGPSLLQMLNGATFHPPP